MEAGDRGDNNLRTQRKSEAAVANGKSQRLSAKTRTMHAGNPNLLSAKRVFSYLAVYYLLILLFVHLRYSRFPYPKTNETCPKTDFLEQNARMHLTYIAGLGPRVAGSPENDAAKDYILDEITKIQRGRRPHHKVEVDVQTVSGTFVLDVAAVGEFTSVYRDVKNVVVKMSPSGGSNNSVLVNCHYDSVVGSPGATDDAVSCCVMLELLRVLTLMEEPFQHNIIFLFNGAEENILQASHGFITQHPWAKSIRTFVNLDAAGAGGWELVFQTGPEHPWLVRAYIETAKYPFATVFGQEVFQSGVVPSDTDYRIFRDYGNLAGLDIAHVKNGYVYHTSNDRPQYVEPGCVQRGGENLLGLVQRLANSKQVVDPGEERHGSMVFFDVMGLFMVSYPQQIASLVNVTTIVLVIFAIFSNIQDARASGEGVKNYLGYLAGGGVLVVMTWAILVTVALYMAWLVTQLERNMAWFTNNYNVFLLFILPGVGVTLLVHAGLQASLLQFWEPWQTMRGMFDFNLVFWSAMLGVGTYYNVGSSYFFLLWVLLPAMIWRGHKGKGPFAVALYQAAILLPTTYMVYCGYLLLIFFMPIQGRLGTALNPDLLVCLISVLPALFIVGYQVGIVYVCRDMLEALYFYGAVVVTGVLLVMWTPMGFPFTSNKMDSSQQRIILKHIDRQFYGLNGSVIFQDSSLWYSPYDYYAEKALLNDAPQLFEKAVQVQCNGTYCGRPYLYPILNLHSATSSWDLPAGRLNYPRVKASVTKREQLKNGLLRLHFSVTGPDHITAFLSPLDNVTLENWSLGDGGHKPMPIHDADVTERPTYFIYSAHENKEGDPWKFYADFLVDTAHPKGQAVVDLAFAGHYLHGSRQVTPELQKALNALPPYTTSTGWSCTFDDYQF